MTFLDLAEGDKLAVVVVELHVGPSDSVMRFRPERQCDAFHMLLVICLDFLHFSTSSAHAHTHAHVLCIAVSAGVRLVSAKEPY